MWCGLGRLLPRGDIAAGELLPAERSRGLPALPSQGTPGAVGVPPVPLGVQGLSIASRPSTLGEASGSLAAVREREGQESPGLSCSHLSPQAGLLDR